MLTFIVVVVLGLGSFYLGYRMSLREEIRRGPTKVESAGTSSATTKSLPATPTSPSSTHQRQKSSRKLRELFCYLTAATCTRTFSARRMSASV